MYKNLGVIIKAIATGNPNFLRKAEVDASIAKLSIKKREHEVGRERAVRELSGFGGRLDSAKAQLRAANSDNEIRAVALSKKFLLEVQGNVHADHKGASAILQQVLTNASRMEWKKVEYHNVGRLLGFDVVIVASPWAPPKFILKGEMEHKVNEAESITIAMMNAIRRVQETVSACEANVQQLLVRSTELQKAASGKFLQEGELTALYEEQDRLYVALGLSSDQSYGAEESSNDEEVVESA